MNPWQELRELYVRDSLTMSPKEEIDVRKPFSMMMNLVYISFVLSFELPKQFNSKVGLTP